MLMILARLVRSESFWAIVKVRSPHTGPEPGYPRSACEQQQACGPVDAFFERHRNLRVDLSETEVEVSRRHCATR